MTPEEERDLFEERSAIREYVGGQSRKEAEAGARQDVKRAVRREANKPSGN